MISQKALSEFIDVSFSYRNLDIISKAVIAIGIISFIVGIIVAIIGINNVGSSYEDFLGQQQVAAGLMSAVSGFLFCLFGFIGLAINDIRKHIATDFNLKYDDPEEHKGQNKKSTGKITCQWILHSLYFFDCLVKSFFVFIILVGVNSLKSRIAAR